MSKKRKQTTIRIHPKKPYDKEKVYYAKIVPLLEKVRKVCRKHGIPVIHAAIYSTTEETEFVSHSCQTGKNGYWPGRFEVIRRIFVTDGPIVGVPIPAAIAHAIQAQQQQEKNRSN